MSDNELKKGAFQSKGDTVTFGRYEGQPLEWTILDENDGHVLLFNKYVIAYGSYHNSDDSHYSWENCDLREWLNNTFISKAFTESERAMIDYAYSEDGCEDEVFLLSKGDITNTYLFEDDDARMCGESYSLERDREKASTIDMYGFTSWKYKSTKGVGIRPAMWVDLNEYLITRG